MIKGTTKIMVNREGIPRIQEELNGQIHVFSLDDWNAELERRITNKEGVVEPSETDEEDNPLIQDDNDEEDSADDKKGSIEEDEEDN
jgi:glucan phosphorylase